MYSQWLFLGGFAFIVLVTNVHNWRVYRENLQKTQEISLMNTQGEEKYFRYRSKQLHKWMKYSYDLSDQYSHFLISLLKPKETEIILDNGCGNARFSIVMAKKKANVIALDINKSILKAALKRIRQEGVGDKIALIVADIENLPCRSNLFDKILCVHNLWYVPNYEKATFEMLRTTKTDGEIILDHLNKLNRSFYYAWISELLYPIRRFLNQDPMPAHIRTPKQILRPFKIYQTETYSLFGIPSVNLFSAREGGNLVISKGKYNSATRLVLYVQKRRVCKSSGKRILA